MDLQRTYSYISSFTLRERQSRPNTDICMELLRHDYRKNQEFRNTLPYTFPSNENSK